jgi:acyl-CoA thioester hydrolase
MRAMQEQRIRIRWRDMDNYGHVNNAVYLTYLEECRDRWARTVLGDAFDFVIVRVAIDYRRELSLLDDEVVVQCRGAGYGHSSIRTTETISTAAGELAAESQSVIVKHDSGDRSTTPLSDAEKALLDASISADSRS